MHLQGENQIKSVAVIGGGPAGMMAAEILVDKGISVDVYDAKPAVLRKFLVAGKGGLNLTKSEEFPLFLSRYGEQAERLKPYLEKFGPLELRSWMNTLGFSTFVGSSSRVFPQKTEALAIVQAWIDRLKNKGVHFHLNHRWAGWNQEKELSFQTKQELVTFKPDAVIVALGGASWPKTGSDGTWAEIIKGQGISIAPFKPANCGFEVNWSDHFRNRYQGTPVKSVILLMEKTNGEVVRQQGEFVITKYGVEGSLIYSFSGIIREEIGISGKATIHLDLMPDWQVNKLQTRLSRPRGSKSISSHLEKSIGLHGVKAGLLWEFLPRSVLLDPAQLSTMLKSFPITLVAARPIEEAISTAGGINFEELNPDLMLHKLPGVFCAGEMLDWEAPTGGYLLTACFSTGRAAALGVIDWLKIQ